MVDRRGPVIAIIFVAYLQAGGTDKGYSQEIAPNQIRAEPRTAKERLGRKASDEQRVDNCKVPPELRGPTPRPDHCADNASTTTKR